MSNAIADSDSDTQFPDKLFYKINEVSRITRLKPYVLRYWETEFPQLAPEKDENDQRRYRKKDVEIIMRIRRLLYEEKFTIAGAKQKIAAIEEGGLDVEEFAGETGKARPAASKSAAAAPSRKRMRPLAKKGLNIRDELASIRSELESLLQAI
ncbi:MAG: MerR family regulatory protein [candidate division BRC1 bacterium ADurb.BinA364]|nr:MAG: MerR family regulatory protein [candidate division BRC1 bacterium ADurb.BinA364]